MKLRKNILKWGMVLTAGLLLFMMGCGKKEKVEGKKEVKEAENEEVKVPEKEYVIWIAGDSTASNHTDSLEDYEIPRLGWGEKLGEYFADNVTVRNMALSGRSSKSFTTEENYQTIMNELKEGDYFLIQFGHNDEKKSEDRYTSPLAKSSTEGSFKWYLKNYYIDPALEKGAIPILMSSIVRCRFENEVVKEQSHVKYAEAMEELVEEYAQQGITVLYMDMMEETENYYNQIGKEEAEKLHAIKGVGESAGLDSTHLNEQGAKVIAGLVVNKMDELELEVMAWKN